MRHPFAVLLLLAALAPSAARASDEADAVAAVKQFIEGFNKGDVKNALAACAPSTTVVDEFAPYLWQGANACAAWANDFDADAKKKGITDAIVKLAKPRHVFVTGDKAYLVVGTSYDYKQGKKKVSQTGATLTAALQKGPDGWRITAWTWSTGKTG
jgi:ketosteroid isomerase-like protein